MFSATAIKSHALEWGFNLVGITRAVPSPYLAAYERWVEAGMHGTMGYMARPDRLARRRDLNVILPDVQSLIIVGLDYGSAGVPDDVLNDPSRGRIASYAWGLDYHDILTPRLEQFAEWLRQASGQSISHRVYVDTGAVLERGHAHQAGLGFTGKNTMLIHPRRGSTFFLGEILTDLEVDTYDAPGRETYCGSCTRCLNACPTNAFPRPHVLDARRCISYLTIEHKGTIDVSLRPLMGNWVYGCDVCQEVCPFQRFALPTREAAFQPPDLNHVAPQIVDLLALDEQGFHQRYYGSPIYRIKRERLVRNACVAAGNWGSSQVITPLQTLLNDPSPLIRSHAAWSLHHIMADDSRWLLQARLMTEHDAGVREAIQSLLDISLLK
ncbi:MAG: tRNA epoxyqueuosine(34) reductase QueG [Chloroflexi bacterium]|nr:tRNA epoxyqueuosine(34) reductase QueG [Chloroflexota bacterium]MCC6897144.1 tRNA epoxyqueuosine(34) reductase QueG [Anaerolineae bacterium]